MANNIIGEPFQKYVRDQITKRQEIYGSGTTATSRTAEDIAYMNSKTAWIKLASGISISGSRLAKENLWEDLQGTRLAQDYVLFGGTSRLEDKNTPDNPSDYPILKQRGTYNGNVNNIWDWYKGAYNVNANLTSNASTGEFGLVPPPGITSADIKCLNRGSIKKATVNIKCYSPEQFKVLDNLYLRIGYTMLLEWGWAPYKNNKGEYTPDYYTLVEAPDGWFSNKAKTNNYVLNQIKGYREKKDGNYDGLLCKVVNFSWKFAQDGSYDITLSLISIGDVIESLKTNVPPSKDISNFLNGAYSLYNQTSDASEDNNIKPTPTNNAIAAYLFLQKLYLDPFNNPDTGIANIEDLSASTLWSEIDGNKLEIPGFFVIPPPGGIASLNPVIVFEGGFDNRADAIQWLKDNGYYTGYTELTGIDNYEQLLVATSNSYLIDCGIFSCKVGVKSFPDPTAVSYKAEKKDVCYINYNNETDDTDEINDDGFYMRLGHLLAFIQDNIVPKVEGTEEPILNIDYARWGNLMKYFPYQVSFDPRVCIVRSESVKIGDLGANQKLYWKQLDGWHAPGEDYAFVMNIYVSHRQIISSLESNVDENGNLTLFDFIQSICTELNKALGGINNLEVILDEESNTLRIIDSSYNPKLSEDYILELYGYNKTNSNFVRNFDLKTEITNDFATMATVGSTAGGYVKGTENTMFSKWNKGLKDRFKEKLVAANKESRIKTGIIAEANEEYTKTIWQGAASAFGLVKKDIDNYVFFDKGLALNDQIINQNIAIATEFYKYCQYEIRENYNKKYASPRTGFVPISLGITMDGISGIKIYNSVNVDTRFLPVNYPESLKFIIKGVNHKLQNNDWETSIETVVIYQNEDYS
jgi:hypothetical protein